MAEFIDEDYVDAFIASEVREKIFEDEGVYNTAAFTQLVVTASQRVIEAARQAGFSLGATTTNETIKQATYGQLLILMRDRRGLEISQNMWTYVQILEDIRLGRIPLDGEDPDEINAVGAASFTSSDETDTTGIATGDTRPQVLKRLRSVY